MVLTLTGRTYLCKKYRLVKNRDRNTVENLNRAGLARIHVCGHEGSVLFPRENEAVGMDEAGS